jgi:EsV-1-7 cysteine-rich motif
MINIKNKHCKCDRAQPTFGYSGDERPTCCAQCRTSDMIDIRTKMCKCGRVRPTFGYAKDKIPTCCAMCRDDDMTNIKCRWCKCGTSQATMGFADDSRPTCCSQCKESGMMNIVSRKCLCGEKTPCFGYADDTRATCCAECREDHMIDIVNRKCCCGKSQPCMGYPSDDKAVYCASCKLEGMIDIKSTRCVHGRQLAKCQGDICGIQNGGRSVEECFAMATHFIISHPSDHTLHGFLKCLAQRIDIGEGRYVKPDYVSGSQICEYDGRYYHAQQLEDDIRKTDALKTLGYSVTRYRDGDLPFITGANNYSVDAKKGPEYMCSQIATYYKQDLSSSMWLKIKALAHRTVLHFQQKNALLKQSSIVPHLS